MRFGEWWIVIFITSHQEFIPSTWFITVDVNLEYCFSTVNLLFLCPPFPSLLGRKWLHRVHTEGMDTYACSPWGQYLHWLFGILLSRNMSILPHLFTQVFIYVIMESWIFILHFGLYNNSTLFMLKLFWLWPFGAQKELKLKVGTHVPLTYSLCVVCLFLF